MDPALAEQLDRELYNPDSREDLRKLQKVLLTVHAVLVEDYGDKISRAHASAVVNIINDDLFWEVAQTAMPSLREPFDPENSLSRSRALHFILDQVKHRLPRGILVAQLPDHERDLITTLSDIVAFLKNLDGPQDSRPCCDRVLHRLATEVTDRVHKWRQYREDERLHLFKLIKGGGIFNLHNMSFNPQGKTKREVDGHGLGTSQFASSEQQPRTSKSGSHNAYLKYRQKSEGRNEAVSMGSPLRNQFDAGHFEKQVKQSQRGKPHEDPHHGPRGWPEHSEKPLGSAGSYGFQALGSDNQAETMSKRGHNVNAKNLTPKSSGAGLLGSRWAPGSSGYEEDPEPDDWQDAWMYQDPAMYRRGETEPSESAERVKSEPAIVKSQGSSLRVHDPREEDPVKPGSLYPDQSTPVSYVFKPEPYWGVSVEERPSTRTAKERQKHKPERLVLKQESGYEADSEVLVTDSDGGVNLRPSPMLNLDVPVKPSNGQHMVYTSSPALRGDVQTAWEKDPDGKLEMLKTLIEEMGREDDDRIAAEAAAKDPQAIKLMMLQAAAARLAYRIQHGEVDTEADKKPREAGPASESETSPTAITRFYNTRVAGSAQGTPTANVQSPAGRDFRRFLQQEFETYPALRAIVREKFRASPEDKELFVQGLYQAFLKQHGEGKPTAAADQPMPGSSPSTTHIKADITGPRTAVAAPQDPDHTPTKSAQRQAGPMPKKENVQKGSATPPRPLDPVNRGSPIPLAELPRRVNATLGFDANIKMKEPYPMEKASTASVAEPRLDLKVKEEAPKTTLPKAVNEPTSEKKAEAKAKPKERPPKTGPYKYLLDSDEDSDAEGEEPLFKPRDPHYGIKW